jgi:hypothetical protein
VAPGENNCVKTSKEQRDCTTGDYLNQCQKHLVNDCKQWTKEASSGSLTNCHCRHARHGTSSMTVNVAPPLPLLSLQKIYALFSHDCSNTATIILNDVVP